MRREAKTAVERAAINNHSCKQLQTDIWRIITRKMELAGCCAPTLNGTWEVTEQCRLVACVLRARGHCWWLHKYKQVSYVPGALLMITSVQSKCPTGQGTLLMITSVQSKCPMCQGALLMIIPVPSKCPTCQGHCWWLHQYQASVLRASCPTCHIDG